MDKVIAISIEKCLACKSCELACALAHSRSEVLEEAIAECPKPQRRVTVEAVGEFGVPMQCRHCEDAPCIVVCPTAAIHRHPDEVGFCRQASCGDPVQGFALADGPVLIDQERCIGCKFCLMVCPFGVIQVSRDGKAVVKCDLCINRVKVGQEPACVEACPTKALKLVNEKELVAGKRQHAAHDLVLSIQEIGKKTKRKESTQ